MKKIELESDHVLVAYNDRSDMTLDQDLWKETVLAYSRGDAEAYAMAYDALAAKRWEVKRAGLKFGNGFAPMYAYHPRTQVLTRLCTHAPEIPAFLAATLHECAFAEYSSSAPWSASKSDPWSGSEMYALRHQISDLVAAGKNVMCWVRYGPDLATLWLALGADDLPAFDPQLGAAGNMSAHPKARGGVLLANDDNSVVGSLPSTNIDVVLHVQAPDRYDQLRKREGDPARTVVEYRNDEVRNACRALVPRTAASIGS
jgi:hypothetical protein